MLTFSNRTSFFRYLKSFNLNQRQDSTTEQAKDMVPVFERLGMFTISQTLCQNFNISNENSKKYEHVCNDLCLKFDLEKDNCMIISNSISIANLFGCYDLADYLQY